jgi:hypothetical protein
MLGRSGLFRVTNVEKRRQNPLDVREWFEKCQDKRFVGPGPKDVDRALDRGSKAAKERNAKAVADMTRQKAERREKLAAAKKRKEERESMVGAGSQAGKEEQEDEHVKDEEEQINSHSQQDPSADDVPALGHSPHSSTESDRKHVHPNRKALTHSTRLLTLKPHGYHMILNPKIIRRKHAPTWKRNSGNPS